MRTPLVLLILAAVWAVALVPPLLRSRADHHPGSSVSSFRRQLSNLSRIPGAGAHVGRVGYGAPARAFRAPAQPARRQDPYGMRMPAAPARPMSRPGYGAPSRGMYGPSARALARRRRQNVLNTLILATVLSGLAWIGIGLEVARAPFFLAAGLLVAYVYLLITIRRNEETRAMQQRYYAYQDAA